MARKRRLDELQKRAVSSAVVTTEDQARMRQAEQARLQLEKRQQDPNRLRGSFKFDPEAPMEQQVAQLPREVRLRMQNTPQSAASAVPMTPAERLEAQAVAPRTPIGQRIQAVTQLPTMSRANGAAQQLEMEEQLGRRNLAAGRRVNLTEMGQKNLAATAKLGNVPQNVTPEFRSLRNIPALAALPNEGNSTDRGVNTIYQNPDGSFSDVPQPGATIYNQGRWAGPGKMGAGILDAPNVGGIPTRVAGEVNDENARNNILRGGGPGAGISYGPRDGTGRRTMTINRTNPYAGMSDAAIAPIAEQKRQQIAARRLSGAAQGGNVLRQVQQLQNQAAKTFAQVNNATNNSRAAERAAGVYQDQARQLIEADRNQVFREGDVLRAQTDLYGIDAQTQAQRERLFTESVQAQSQAGLELEKEARETGNKVVEQVATFNGEDGSSYVDYDGLAIASDLLGIDPRESTQLTKNATAVRGLIRFRSALQDKLGYLPDATELRRIMDQAAGARNLDWGDAFKEGDIGLLDVLLSNVGFGPNALRLGEDTAFTYDPKDFTRNRRDTFRLRDRDR